MTLAIKYVHNCHLTLVVFLHYLKLHKEPKRNINELKQRLIDT